MYLDNIFGSKTKINILSKLLENPSRSFVEKELSKESGCSPSEINRQIDNLVSSGLVKMERVSRVKIYKINEKHFLYKPLKNLFKDLLETYREISMELVEFSTKKYELKSIILLGSLSKRKIKSDITKSPSDIDIVFIVKDKDDVNSLKKDLVDFINNEISYQYGIPIYPIVVSEDYYKERLKKDSFIIEVHANGEVIYGKKPERLS